MNLKKSFSVAAFISFPFIVSLTGNLTTPPPSQQPHNSPSSQAWIVPDDLHWTPGFTLNGVDGLHTLAADGTNLYAGGYFSIIGGMFANNIAKWNASTNHWSGLGDGMNDSVWALAIDRSGNLYAGGFFTLAGSTAANRIARWDGSAWSALGDGVNGNVKAIAVEGNGNVYVGGSFSTAGGLPANNIAKWDAINNSWSALGSGMNDPVNSLVIDKNGIVYAGGSFATAGGLSVNNVARWNGNTWEELGAGITGGSTDGPQVSTLVVDDFGNLYAGGDFTFAGAVGVNNIARWDGSDWSALGAGLTGESFHHFARDLAVHNNNLYVVGDFTMAGGISANYIAKWNGNNWETLSSGTNNYASGLAIDQSGNVYVSGRFNDAGETGANGIARWDGQNWSIVGSDRSLNSNVFAITADKNNQIYAGGAFTYAGGKSANHIAMWNGSDWSALGEGIPGTYCDGYSGSCVLALSTDGNSNLFAGGTFTMTAGINTNHIAMWDGSRWSALNTGTNGTVKVIATDKRGNVYAGGLFSMAGETSANNIARWNMSTNQWESLGTGLDGSVSALVADRNGNLYAGGTFTQTGELAVNHIAMWNGSAWSALGTGVCCGGINKGGMDLTEVSALALDHSGNLYAGGLFTQAGSTSANYVAMWNGINWQALGNGITAGSTQVYGPNVNAIAVDTSDHLIVGGDITEAGEVPVQGIALWDGSAWLSLGSGLNGCLIIGDCVEAMATDIKGNIYAGGSFDIAGGKPSANFAKWTPHIFQIYFPWVAH